MYRHRLKELLQSGLGQGGRITILTGAGISAESGIPTFRGPEGFWTIGSRAYHPQEIATYRMFQQDPRAVWQWYLYRLRVCRRSDPNAGHHALVEMERCLPGRFTLVTQNVDNLHLRSGQGAERTYEIHGNINFFRCAGACREEVVPIPKEVTGKRREEPISDMEWELLHCPSCGHLMRPHVLWFDESYNEQHYRYESTLEAARTTSLLLVVGTSGATTLPNHLVSEVIHNSGAIIDINIERNPFGQIAGRYDRGMAIRETSGTALPRIVRRMKNLIPDLSS